MTIFEANSGYGRTGVAATASAEASLANKVSWGAIFAGVTIALVVQVVLTLVGTGIGIATLDPAAGAAGNSSAASLSLGAAGWTLVSALVAAFLGGVVAARMSGRVDHTSAMLHGLTTWAFTTLIVLYLLTTAVGSLVGGAVSGVTQALGGVGQAAVQTAAPAIANSDVNPLDAIESEVRSTGTDPEALRANAVNAVRALLVGGQQGTQEARNQAAQALAAARGIPADQAQQQIAGIEQRYRTAVDAAKQKATEAAAATASALSKGALMAALALVLGGVAGAAGGRLGTARADPYGTAYDRY